MMRYPLFVLSLIGSVPLLAQTALFPVDREKIRTLLESPQVAAKFEYYQGIDSILKNGTAADVLSYKLTSGHCFITVELAPSENGEQGAGFEVSKVGSWACGD
jgi:hypothetical protein